MSDRQVRVLRAAADVTGETVTGFILAAATERAHDVLGSAERIDLRVEAFERFVAALDDPIVAMPALERYVREPSPIRPG